MIVARWLAVISLAACGRVDFSDATSERLVAWYPMETDPAAQLIIDVSPDPHDGTCSGSGCPTRVAGVIGFGYAFAAGNNFTVFDDGRFDLVDGFTVAVWCNPSLLNGARTLVSKPQATGPGASFELYLADGVATFCTDDDLAPSPTAESCMGQVTISANAWTHLAITWDGTVKHLYIDGADAASDTRSTLYDSTALVIGADMEDGALGSPFVGELDELRIFGRALAPDEILRLYAER